MTFKKHWIHQGGVCAAIGILLVLFVIPAHLGAQKSWDNIPLLLTPPLQYGVPKAAATITVDGRADEDSWSAAAWMNFVDIETGAEPERKKGARSKLLWDNDNLYVYAEFTETDVWATLDRHDASVFMDNAFEMFLNPDGTTFNYFEFQMNALGTVWDLLLPRPYRHGGKPFTTWDIKGLKKAVHVAGTVNDPSDRDASWSIELAVPFASLNVRNTSQLVNAVWRMNFSRVQWETAVVNGRYDKVRTEGNRFGIVHYDVWSPVGIIDLHYPERWGYVLFADGSAVSGKLVSEEQIELELALWRYYYLQHMYREEKGEFASGIDELNAISRLKLPGLQASKIAVEMFSNKNQFWLQGKLAGSPKQIAIDHEGEIRYIE